MAQLFRVMQADHDLAWALVKRLTGGRGDPIVAPAGRRRLARDLVVLEAAHEIAEALVVWPAVRESCPAGDELVAEALLQEGRGKTALNELRRISSGTEELAQCERCASTVASHFREHMSFERHRLWPLLEECLGDSQLERLTDEYLVVRATAPTPGAR